MRLLAGILTLLFVGERLVEPVYAVAPGEVNDVVLTIHARTLFFEDEVLRPHNIGVRVQGRVAVLWGPIADMDLGLRAESRLRGMIELRGVCNELHLMPRAGEFADRRSQPRSPDTIGVGSGVHQSLRIRHIQRPPT